MALAAAPLPEPLTLTLRPGDTLIGISAKYLVPERHWRELQRHNRIADPHRLRTGTTLQIPLDWLRWSALPVEVVHVHPPVTGARGALTVGMQLGQGDRFEVGPEGALTLRFADGSLAAFAARTRATLGLSRAAPLGGVRAIRIDLEQGAVETTVQPLATPQSRFEVRTPRVITAVRGTRFRVGLDAQGSRHEVLEGRVGALGAPPLPSEIGPGQGLRARDGELGAVVPLLPAPDVAQVPTRIERTAQLLQVVPQAGASGWHWQVATDGAFVQRVQEATTREPNWLLSGLPDGDYFLRVRAADAQSIEGTDAQVAFALRARPEPPLKLAPAADASVVAGTALAWAQVVGAPAYHLQVARDARFADLVVDRAGLTGSRHVPEPALAPGRYHWRLATQRPDGSRGPFGDAASFTILAPTSLAPPQLGPAGLTLSWSGPIGFPHQVQVARSADFAPPLLLDRQVPGASLTVPDPAPGGYFVRSRVVLPDGSTGPWSQVQRLDVPTPAPPAPTPWYWLLLFLLPLL